jgi:hypothetical protein
MCKTQNVNIGNFFWSNHLLKRVTCPHYVGHCSLLEVYLIFRFTTFRELAIHPSSGVYVILQNVTCIKYTSYSRHCPTICYYNDRFEAFTEVMFPVEVFWVLTPCSVVLGYQRSEVHVVSIFRATSHWRWSQHSPLKRRYPTTTLHVITIQKTSTWNIIII